jgi:hypothetical protein
MHTERIVVLISLEEKSRLQEAARSNKQSLGEFVRTVLSRDDAPAEDASNEVVHLSKDQRDALENAAKRASAALSRSNQALDKAFAEIETTRAHFANSAIRQFLSERAARVGRGTTTGVAIKAKAAAKSASRKAPRRTKASPKLSKA